ncbi:MAG: hypothetical protein U0228_19150 [Myxococcaceae bacterium]
MSCAVLLVACPASGPADAGDLGDSGASTPSCIEVPAEIDFGEVPVFTTTEVNVALVNHSTAPITIEFGELSAPFSAGQSGPIVVGPDLTLPIRFAFAPFDARLQVADISFVGGAGCAPTRVRFQGLGRGRLEAPDELNFDALAVGQTTTGTVRVSNTGRLDFDVEVMTMTLEPPAKAPMATFTVPAFGTFDLPLEFSPQQLGTHFVTLELFVPMTGQLLTTRLFVSAGLPTATPGPSVDAGLLPLAPQIINHILSTRVVTVSNTGVADLRLLSSEVIAGPDSDSKEVAINFLPPSIPPGQTSQVHLLFFTAGQPGPRQWTVRLHTNDPAHEAADIAVTGTAIDQPPCARPVTGTPDPLVLSTAVPRTATLTLTNPNGSRCFVDAFRAQVFCASAYSFQPADGQFFLDSLETRVVTVTASSSSPCLLLWETWGASDTVLSVTAP